jgi:type II secretory pathway component GspD/PulD (secretin)
MNKEDFIKTLSVIALIFLSGSIYGAAKAYDLNMELSLDGKKTASPRMIVEAGKSGTITQEANNKKSFIEVVANEGQMQNNEGILMKFVIGTIDNNGKKTITSRPEIFARENEKAQITIHEQDGKETLSLSVTAQRKDI